MPHLAAHGFTDLLTEVMVRPTRMHNRRHRHHRAPLRVVHSITILRTLKKATKNPAGCRVKEVVKNLLVDEFEIPHCHIDSKTDESAYLTAVVGIIFHRPGTGQIDVAKLIFNDDFSTRICGNANCDGAHARFDFAITIVCVLSGEIEHIVAYSAVEFKLLHSRVAQSDHFNRLRASVVSQFFHRHSIG